MKMLMVICFNIIFSIFSWNKTWVSTFLICPGVQPRLKSWGDQGLGPNTAQPEAGLGVSEVGGYPSRCRSLGVIKFVKTQMLNPAFWWLLHSLVTILAVKFLAFWKLRPKSWGDQYIVGPPNLKVVGTSLHPVHAVVTPHISFFHLILRT